MIIPKIQIVTALRFFHRYFIWILVFSYVIAGVMPELGLWIRNIGFGRATTQQSSLAISLPMLMLAVLFHDQTLYRQRHKIENMFGKLKDWRRIHTRYDRCAHTFFSAICIAATIIFWINQ
jgi:hypothetical protein